MLSLLPYIDDVVKTYRGDPRILMWDVMNQPSSMGIPKIAQGNGQFAWDFAHTGPTTCAARPHASHDHRGRQSRPHRLGVRPCRCREFPLLPGV